jgi:hypothetical protein
VPSGSSSLSFITDSRCRALGSRRRVDVHELEPRDAITVAHFDRLAVEHFHDVADGDRFRAVHDRHDVGAARGTGQDRSGQDVHIREHLDSP